MGQMAFAEARPCLYGTRERCVREADRLEVDWMIRRHYIGKWPGVVVATLGLFCADEPRGVLVFALPPPETFARYGGLTWELARLWVDDSEPTNTESWFIARAVRYVRQRHRDVVALVSYADPRQGHTGVIYRASNWAPDGMTDEGRTTPRFDYAAFGRLFSRRSHVPDGATVERVPRVSKYRYVYRLKERGPRLNLGLGVAGLVYDPFGAAPSDSNREAA